MSQYLGARAENIPWKTIAIVFLLSLAARLVAFVLMLDFVEPDQMLASTPDVRNYVAAAEAIREQLNFHSDRMHIFGPGFPVFLALLQSITLDPRFIVVVQILIASVSSALVVDIAWQLTKRPAIALVAGTLHALSIASIALSNILLSDTLYFGLLAAGLSFYLRGLRTNRLAFFLPAAVFLGISPLVRAVGLYFFLPLIFITLVWTWPNKGETWKQVRSRLALPAACLLAGLVIIGSWLFRDKTPEEPRLAYSTHSAMFKLISQTRSRVNGTTYEAEYALLHKDIDSARPLYGNLFYGALVVVAPREMGEVAVEHPFSLARSILTNAWVNCNNSRDHLHDSFPRMRPKLDSFRRDLDSTGLQYRATLFTLLGLILLIRFRAYRTALILAAITGYFAIMSGFTLDQGNRIYYPGMIGWSVLCAVPVVAVVNKLISLRQSRVKSQAA